MHASAIVLVALFALGFGAWSFLEYVIHGWLSHTFETPAATMHRGHHRDPRRVFTSVVVWAPTALAIYALLALAIGATTAGAIVLGVYHGVTTRLWDRLLGTLPAHHREDYGRVAHHVPLAGASNFGSLWPKRG